MTNRPHLAVDSRSLVWPALASLTLGVLIASPFWWALSRRLISPTPALAPDASVQAMTDAWPTILVLGGALWGAALAGWARGRPTFWLAGAAAGALGSGIFAQAIVMGVAAERISASLPQSAAERFVLQLPLFVGLVAGVSGVLMTIAVGRPRLAFFALLIGAACGSVPALVISVWAYVLGLRVGTGGAAMALISAPALTLGPLSAGTALAWLLRKPR